MFPADTLLREVKKQARRAARAELAAISDAEFAAMGQSMLDFLQKDAVFQKSGSVFCFVSCGSEPDTRPILSAALQAGKRLCVPRIPTPGVMQTALLPALSQLAPGAFGIPEPPADAPVLSPDEIELALLPCLCAAPDGRRLGHGGGYYDRFLAGYHGASILLCPHALLRQSLPCGALDLPAQRVLTERGFAE